MPRQRRIEYEGAIYHAHGHLADLEQQTFTLGGKRMRNKRKNTKNEQNYSWTPLTTRLKSSLSSSIPSVPSLKTSPVLGCHRMPNISGCERRISNPSYL
jgi:hypothetical protein